MSIDINSARATKAGDIEATALNTNLEAAEEIARQLRLRDLGGLVVIDYIDMALQKNQREVENRLREAVRQDRARVQLGKISRFGLLEMSRQRLRPSLGESNYLVCPRCSGLGNIRSVESLALAILRIIGEEARKERTVKVIAQLPVEVATYLINEKRDWVQGLERRHETQVILVANPALDTPHYDIRRVRDDQADLPENAGTSYALADLDEESEITQAMQNKKPAEVAAVTTVVQTAPVPPRPKLQTPGQGLIQRISNIFTNSSEKPEKNKKKDPHRQRTHKKKQQNPRRGNSQRGRQRNDGQKHLKNTGRQNKKKQTRKSANKDSQGKEQTASNRSANLSQTNENSQKNHSAENKQRSRGGRRRRRKPQTTTDVTNQSTKISQTKEETITSDKKGKQKKRSKPQRSKNTNSKSTVRDKPIAKTSKKDASKSVDKTGKKDKQPSLPNEERSVPKPKRNKAEVTVSQAKKEKPNNDEKPAGQLLPWDSNNAPKPKSKSKD